MNETQLDSLLVHAFDGVQRAGRDPHEVSDDLLAGIWWTLGIVRGALNDRPIAIKAMQELGNGNVDLKGMSEYIHSGPPEPPDDFDPRTGD